MPQWQLRGCYYSNMTALAQKTVFLRVCVWVRETAYLLWWRTSGCLLYHPPSRCLWNQRTERITVKLNMEKDDCLSYLDHKTCVCVCVCVCVCGRVTRQTSVLHTGTGSTFHISQLSIFLLTHTSIQQTNDALAHHKKHTELFSSEIYTPVCYIQNKAD